jgi:hypothetical protein
MSFCTTRIFQKKNSQLKKNDQNTGTCAQLYLNIVGLVYGV